MQLNCPTTSPSPPWGVTIFWGGGNIIPTYALTVNQYPIFISKKCTYEDQIEQSFIYRGEFYQFGRILQMSAESMPKIMISDFTE